MTNQAKTQTAPVAKTSVFVPKQDAMEALGESLNRIKVLKAEIAKTKKVHDALIEEAKTTMRLAGVKEYTNEQGIKALAYEFLRTDLDKDMVKEMLGAERYALAEVISVVEAFKVS